MARGDHLHASRPAYHHDGIDLGDGRVVHLAADEGGPKATACVRISTFEEFAGDGTVMVRQYAGDRDPDAIVERALSRVGRSGYDLVTNNCEHFARWCVTGDHHSEQVVAGVSAAGAVSLPWLAGNVGLNLVASAGVVGTSGAGVMSGLAAAGAVVGGGAVAGVAVLGAGPAVAAAFAVHRFTLADDPDLPDAERRSRTAGRVGAVVGGAAGLAGAGWAIGALGIPGVSAVGISTGLAALGGFVGGGMAVGTALAVALPAVGVALGAYLLYSLWMWAERTWTALSGPRPLPTSPAG